MPYDIVLGRNDSDKKEFGKKGTIFIGKGYVKMGQRTSLSNSILMDVVRSHVVLVAGKRGCLTEDTMVFTNKGYKKIKDFDKKNDKILSFDKKDRKFEWKKADLLEYPIENEKLFQIELKDGRRLNLTKEHPLLVSAKNNGLSSLMWIKSQKLKIGDNLLSVNKNFSDIEPVKIKSIKKISGIKKVYDLTVDKNHSFIANGVISHNSGKSYTLGVIVEELSNLPREVSQNIGSLIFDTMGIYWPMKYANEKDKELLRDWDLKPKRLPVKIFVPFGYYDEHVESGIPVDSAFALDVSEMEPEDWILTFGLDLINPVSVLIERAIIELKEETDYFSIQDMIDKIDQDERATVESKNAAISLFQAADTWGVFAKDPRKATHIEDLINGGTTTVLDLSVYNAVGAFNVRALVISLISRKIFNQRMASRKKEEISAVSKSLESESGGKKENPLVWIFIDEAHEFLPKEGKTAATDALVQLLREGRQPGISLVLATQQPGKIHRDVMTQSDLLISHRITSQQDVGALGKIMQTYLLKGIKQQMDELPSEKGSAIILDDTSERIYSMRIRPRFTWHGGEAPIAIRRERGL